MKKNKYKILVLSDLNKSTSKTLQSTVSLAKMINAEINFFYVKKPNEIIENDNQLSANRVINKEYTITDKDIQNLINPISKDYGVTINYTYSFGNVKNEIEKFILDKKPNMIVLGKRKSKALNFIGDNITDFVLKTHSGAVLIVDKHNTLEPGKKLSLGILNNMDTPFNMVLMDDLMANTQEPIKSFKIIKNTNTLKESDVPKDKNTIEYVFEHNDNIIKNLSNYLSKNNVNLLCVDRSDNKKNPIKSDVKDVIKNLNVCVLLTGSQ
ncbi:universal stress protein [Mariniflexile sp.]|uniref:universal stress protein n=1 Tax=Mariniflexile sp. TaxID=1979402 RepID=UPI004048031F